MKSCLTCGNPAFKDHHCEATNYFCSDCGQHFYQGHHGGVGGCPSCGSDEIKKKEAVYNIPKVPGDKP